MTAVYHSGVVLLFVIPELLFCHSELDSDISKFKREVFKVKDSEVNSE